jgi:phage-related protein
VADKAFYTAWAEIAPDFSKFGREVDKGFQDSLGPAGQKGGDDAGKGVKKGMLGAIGAMAGPLAAAFAGLKLGEAIFSTIKDGIGQANDLEQTISAVQTVFGDASGSIEQFAKDAVQGLGITRQQALEASQMFGTFGKSAGLTGEELSGFANEMAGLGGDLAAFYGGDVQTALDAISSGLRGESEPLRQYGVLLDDATLKARAMALGISDGSGTLTSQQKILAAQAEILAQTTDAQGAAGREAASFDGQLKRLSAGWESVVTTIGQLFLPIVTQVVTFLNANVIPAIQGFFTALQEGDLSGFIGSFASMRDSLIRTVAEAFPGIITAVVQGISSLIATVVDVLPGVVDAVVTMIPTIVSLLTSSVPLLVQGAMTLFQGIIDALVTLIPELIGTLVTLIPRLIQSLVTMVPILIQGAITLFMALVAAIPVIVPLLITELMNLLPVLVSSLGTLLPALIEGAVQLFMALVEAIPIIIPALITGLLDLIPVLIETVIGLIPVLIDSAVQLFTGLVEAIPVIIPALIDALIELGPQIVETIIGLVPQLFEAGEAIIQGLIDGIGSMFGAVGDAVGGVMDYLGGFFPHSPAKRGPFSGSGWTQLQKSGAAIYDEFMSGFGGDDPTFPSISPSVRLARPAPLDDTSGDIRSAGGGSGITQNNYIQHMPPDEAVEMSGQRLASLARQARA